MLFHCPSGVGASPKGLIARIKHDLSAFTQILEFTASLSTLLMATNANHK